LDSAKWISIPYGAIKRKGFSDIVNKFQIFQFLMVRLKDDLRIGSVVRLLKFQFLMVRLKVILFWLKNKGKRLFQFLMVRLKE